MERKGVFGFNIIGGGVLDLIVSAFLIGIGAYVLLVQTGIIKAFINWFCVHWKIDVCATVGAIASAVT